MIIKNSAPIIIKLFSKPVCSLCTEAKSLLYPIIDEIGNKKFVVEEIDIGKPENSEHFQKFKYDIPVAMIDSKIIFKHRIDEDKLFYDLESILKDKEKEK
eukprot:gene4180-5231_t